MGEIGVHHIDQVGWFSEFDAYGRLQVFGAVRHWQDGREVPDTIQAMFEYAKRP